MAHDIHRVTSFELTDKYTIRVEFVDPEVGTLVWPNGADFDPATLHDWPQVMHELIIMARSWRDEERKSGTR